MESPVERLRQPPAAPPGPLAHLEGHLFQPMGASGVYARTALYTGILERLERYVDSLRDPRSEVLRFPPVMSRSQLERSGYLGSFPNLLGCVCSLHGNEAAIRAAADQLDSGGDWTGALAASDLVLTPAACYPLYPIAAARGPIPVGGWVFDIEADCFRREPSEQLDRMQSFRMREFVKLGTAEEIVEFREQHMAGAGQIAMDLDQYVRQLLILVHQIG